MRGDAQEPVCGVFEVLLAGAPADGLYGACHVCPAVGVEDFEAYHLVAGVGDGGELRAVEVALQAHPARYRGEASGQRLACRVAVFDVVFVAVAHVHHEVEDAAGARLFGRGGVGCGFLVAVAEAVPVVKSVNCPAVCSGGIESVGFGHLLERAGFYVVAESFGYLTLPFGIVFRLVSVVHELDVIFVRIATEAMG